MSEIPEKLPLSWCPRCGASEEWRHALQIQYECGSAHVEGQFQETDECRQRRAMGEVVYGSHYR